MSKFYAIKNRKTGRLLVSCPAIEERGHDWEKPYKWPILRLMDRDYYDFSIYIVANKTVVENLIKFGRDRAGEMMFPDVIIETGRSSCRLENLEIVEISYGPDHSLQSET